MTELADVVTLPFLPFTSAEQASGVLWKLYEKYPAITSQFKDNRMLLLWSSTPYFMHTTKKQVKTAEDLQGLKIRVPGGPPTEMIKLLGGTPMMVGMPDTYLNMQKGVMDGMANNFSSIITFRHYEVAKYYTYVPLFTVYFGQAVNKDSWNRLPKDIQDQLANAGGALNGSKFWGKNMFDSSVNEGPQIIKQAGYEMSQYTIPADELEKWTNIAGKPLWDSWVKKMEGRGYKEAREILDATIEMIKTTK